MPRTFAVGDIHGHNLMLAALRQQIDAVAQPGDTLVFLGDYIDRGPDSKATVQAVLNWSADWDGPVVHLLRNHEHVLLDYIDEGAQYDPRVWLLNGGADCCLDYDAQSGAPEEIVSRLPDTHLKFFQGLVTWYEDDHAIYVHAGLRPGWHPERLTISELCWIRDEFLHSSYAWRKMVVFGHTPQTGGDRNFYPRGEEPWAPLVEPNKLGIDTGCAFGGPLTAVMLPERQFFSVDPAEVYNSYADERVLV